MYNREMGNKFRNSDFSKNKQSRGNWPVTMNTTRYDQGTNACGNCQHGRHTSCRPRLDGTLCSCSCDTASTMRVAHEHAEYAAGNVLTLKESIGTFYPVITKDF